ncbi:MAG: DUF808 domain-containing protein [Proteobacteria bacterium]|nr:DUF808 domain-containing protein [Pseudomonadota bacterium]
MASSLLALIDDIATILNDVALMTKVAAKKTAGVLGDDLALNAQQVTGVHPDRELPVVWAVGVGSLMNKVILVPLALAISFFAPWAITPLLMVGGAFLCFEGVEKLAHKFLHSQSEDDLHHKELSEALANPTIDMLALERDKIKGAIRTDFILSAEIIVISLGTVATASFSKQVAVLAGIAVIMTVGVYGLVAGIVKLDDLGLYLSRKSAQWKQKLGNTLLAGAPYLMKTLSVVGTIAMFMVGGAILVHGIPPVHHAIDHLAAGAASIPTIGGVMRWLIATVLDVLLGMLIGTLVLVTLNAGGRLFKTRNKVA